VRLSSAAPRSWADWGACAIARTVSVIRIAFLGLLLVTGFYLITGMAHDEGGFGVQLVVKPRPSLTLLVGGHVDDLPKSWLPLTAFAKSAP